MDRATLQARIDQIDSMIALRRRCARGRGTGPLKAQRAALVAQMLTMRCECIESFDDGNGRCIRCGRQV